MALIIILFAIFPGIMTLVLLFKIWDLCNNVSEIHDSLMSKPARNYHTNMLLNKKEEAYQIAVSELANYYKQVERIFTSNGKSLSDINIDRFSDNLSKLDKYIKRIELTGFEVPEHLKSAEAYINFAITLQEVKI